MDRRVILTGVAVTIPALTDDGMSITTRLRLDG